MTKAEKNMIATLNVAISAMRQAGQIAVSNYATDKKVFGPAVDDISAAIREIESLIERIDPDRDIAA